MKVEPECCPCMLERALLFCRNEPEEVKYKVVREICRLFAEDFSEKRKTIDMAAARNEIIERVTKDKDPLREIKNESFAFAEKLYPKLRKHVSGIKNPKRRFNAALMIALAGNIVEFGARDHKINLKNLEKEILSVVKGKLAIDDTEKAYKKIQKAKNILYVTDNVAELVFDRIFIEELSAQRKKIFIAPLARTVQDDAWINDVKKAKIKAEIIPRGDFIGIWFEKCTPEFLKAWKNSDIIIAKGMACYETLTDYPEKTKGKVAMLFKVKCVPVARHVGVQVGSAVVKVI